MIYKSHKQRFEPVTLPSGPVSIEFVLPEKVQISIPTGSLAAITLPAPKRFLATFHGRLPIPDKACAALAIDHGKRRGRQLHRGREDELAIVNLMLHQATERARKEDANVAVVRVRSDMEWSRPMCALHRGQ